MIQNKLCHLVPLALSLLAITSARAETISPIIFSSSGSVSAKEPGKESTPIVEKTPLPKGTSISTGNPGVALVALAPGISLKLRSASSITLHNTHYSAETTTAEVDLILGDAICLLRPSGNTSRTFRINMGQGESASAIGTAWQSTNSALEKLTLVATGAVRWKSQIGGPSILVSSGSLLISTYDSAGKVKSVIVINLSNGSLSEYPLDGSSPDTKTAAQDQIVRARALFQNLVSEIYNSLGAEERGQLNDLLKTINRILADAKLEPIAVPAETPPPPGPSNNPSDEVSPIRP